jgi:hypothetical protein
VVDLILVVKQICERNSGVIVEFFSYCVRKSDIPLDFGDYSTSLDYPVKAVELV